MTPDPHAAAALVAREVQTGLRAGLATRTVAARRPYATGQADLWDAVTNPERLPRWFLPISGELRPGGRYQLEGNAYGTVEHCEEPAFFAVTWEFAEHISWLRVTLAPAPRGTTLEFAHEAPVDPDVWAQYGPGAAGVGWDLGLLSLGLHLDTGADVEPNQSEVWPTTPAGIDFVRQAAEGWSSAGIADGDDPDDAHQAAERTVAFYTGVSDA